jgi:uracil-DNA glycosylase family 4
MTCSIENFERFKQIADTVIPYEIRLMTHYNNGWEDCIDMRGKNLKITITDEASQFDFYIKISDERGLSVKIPCEGVEIINEFKNKDNVIIEIYFFIYEGFAQLTIKGREIFITNTDKEIEYNKLIDQAKNCIICEAMKHEKAVLGYENGNLDSDVMFIAEAPGSRGANLTRIPLHGDATGDNFEKLLSATRWTRSDIYITNAVLCCPTDEKGKVRKPSKQEIKNCHSYLARIIELVNPKVIVTLGKTALEALKEIEPHQLVLNKDVATFSIWNGRFVYPLYHPSPQVINTKTRTFEQQRTDFKQLEYNYRFRILKELEPIKFKSKEAE